MDTACVGESVDYFGGGVKEEEGREAVEGGEGKINGTGAKLQPNGREV